VWNLNPQKYTPVFLSLQKIRPYLVDPSAVQAIEAMCNYLPLLSPSEVSEIQSREEKILIRLGLAQYQFGDEPFLREEVFEDRRKSTVMMKTEKKIHPRYSGAPASTRHFLTPILQAKGIGRHSYAETMDFAHSWGGMSRTDVVKSVLMDELIRRHTKLGVISTVAAFNYEAFPFAYFVLRQCDTYRLSQFSRDFFPEVEKLLILEHFEKRFRSNDLLGIFFRIIDQYFVAWESGIELFYVDRENLTIDGRFIDTESFQLYPAKKDFLKLSLLMEGRPTVDLKGCSLGEVLEAYPEVRILTSSFHTLKHVIFYYVDFFNALDDRLDLKHDSILSAILFEKGFSEKNAFVQIPSVHCEEKFFLRFDSKRHALHKVFESMIRLVCVSVEQSETQTVFRFESGSSGNRQKIFHTLVNSFLAETDSLEFSWKSAEENWCWLQKHELLARL
jgi:hypothetical protein